MGVSDADLHKLPIAKVDEFVAVELVAANDHRATCGSLHRWTVPQLLLNVLPKAPEACTAAAPFPT